MIKEYRESRGLSQRELANLMSKDIPGVDKALISKLENGLVAPSERMIAWCCNGQNSSIDEPKSPEGITDRKRHKDARNADFTHFEWSVYNKLLNTDFNHRISRGMLVAYCGATDRQVRKAIESLRRAGIRIGSGLGNPGYWIINNEEDYKAFVKEYVSRAYEVIRTKRAMDKGL